VNLNLGTLITDVLAEVRAESPKPSTAILALWTIGVKLNFLGLTSLPLASFFDSLPQLAPVAAPSIFDLLLCLTPIVGGRDHGQCAVDTNQDHRSNFMGDSRVLVDLASALEHLVRAMDNSPPLESISFADERIDDINFDGRVALDVPDRLR
jgi:hypothetical protein